MFHLWTASKVVWNEEDNVRWTSLKTKVLQVDGVGSSDPTQRSWTMILTCTCTCTCTTVPSRCLYQAAALVIWCFSLSRYHFRCIIPPLMLRSLHPIEVVGIITKKKKKKALKPKRSIFDVKTGSIPYNQLSMSRNVISWCISKSRTS